MSSPPIDLLVTSELQEPYLAFVQPCCVCVRAFLQLDPPYSVGVKSEHTQTLRVGL